MSFSVFIDGSEGTTGLRIHEYFEDRDDIEVIPIDPQLRKNVHERARLINSADASFLCLPDVASREIVEYIDPSARVLDTSTAHRVSPDWTYGLPELCPGQREKIAASNRVAVPGCHATGFIVLARPLVSLGIVDSGYPFSCHSVTGYSGGGKKMIAQYEGDEKDEKGLHAGEPELQSPRQYGLTQTHKHLPEMTAMACIDRPPLFNPIVADYFSGMVASVPLHVELMKKEMSLEDVRDAFSEYYEGQPMISVMPAEATESGFLGSNALSGRNNLEIYVYGNDDRIMLASRYDNLGKGASGAAVQCMNIMLGLDETTGLL